MVWRNLNIGVLIFIKVFSFSSNCLFAVITQANLTQIYRDFWDNKTLTWRVIKVTISINNYVLCLQTDFKFASLHFNSNIVSVGISINESWTLKGIEGASIIASVARTWSLQRIDGRVWIHTRLTDIGACITVTIGMTVIKTAYWEEHWSL